MNSEKHECKETDGMWREAAEGEQSGWSGRRFRRGADGRWLILGEFVSFHSRASYVGVKT